MVALADAEATLAVFPGAQGFGTDTPAGRGGRILRVTNLNDSGPGSLRAAVAVAEARIVVFEVSGAIKLNKTITIRNPYITIAGQTAPAPGIMLKGAGLTIVTHDVLVQHLAIRVGDGSTGPAPDDRDGLQILAGPDWDTRRVVVDHLSISWAIDENQSSWGGPQDITISNSIISEALYNSLHSKGPHSMGTLIGDNSIRFSMIGNLLAHNHDRHPLIKGGATAAIINNVMYNGGAPWWMFINDDYNSGAALASVVGNVLIAGVNTPSTAKPFLVMRTAKSGTQVYLADNIAPVSQFLHYETSFNPQVTTAPLWPKGLTALGSASVVNSVLTKAGSRPAERDAVDKRIINDVKNRTGSRINSQRDVGGWPNYPMNTRTFTIPANPNGDDDGNGYTNIEEILHKMAAQVEGRHESRCPP
jgi:hypothetical protein